MHKRKGDRDISEKSKKKLIRGIQNETKTSIFEYCIRIVSLLLSTPPLPVFVVFLSVSFTGGDKHEHHLKFAVDEIRTRIIQSGPKI